MSTATQVNDFGVATGRDTVRIERMLPGPIERVWSYLTDSEKRRSWFAGGPAEMRPGASFDLQFHNGKLDSEPAPAQYEKFSGEFSFKSRVIACEEPRLFAFTMPMGGAESEVRIELTPRGDKVHLVLTHSRLATREGMLSVSGGWHAHLKVLADRLAGREPKDFWATMASVAPEYQKRIPG